MKTQWSSKVASSSLMVLGAGHLFTQFVLMRGNHSAMVEALQSATVALPGRTLPFVVLSEGFSVMMGLLLIGLGALSWHLDRWPASIRRTTAWLLAAFCAALSALSVVYFFVVPILLTGISAAFWLLFALFDSQVTDGKA